MDAPAPSAEIADKTEHRTPANALNERRELRPLPLRVADSQYRRLTQARNRTGISVQEHVRRAIELYLAVIEKEAIELGLMELPNAPQAQPTVEAPRRNPKVERR